jgi:hypothetical protein
MTPERLERLAQVLVRDLVDDETIEQDSLRCADDTIDGRCGEAAVAADPRSGNGICAFDLANRAIGGKPAHAIA